MRVQVDGMKSLTMGEKGCFQGAGMVDLAGKSARGPLHGLPVGTRQYLAGGHLRHIQQNLSFKAPVPYLLLIPHLTMFHSPLAC